MSAVLVDAGPLVALIDQSDPQHQECRNSLESISDTLLTVWPAVTEAMHLLRFSWEAQAALLEWLETGQVGVLTLTREDMRRVRELMGKYRDLPMDLADAALVCVAEREKIRRVFTLDRRGFNVYRPSRLGRFLLIPE